MITSSRVNNVVVAFTYERRNNLHNSVAPDVLLFRAPPSFVIPTTNSRSSRTCLRSFEKRKQKKFKKYATSAGNLQDRYVYHFVMAALSVHVVISGLS